MQRDMSRICCDPATSAADGGIGMMTCGVQNMQNGRGDGGSLFAGRRKTVQGVKMKTKAVQIFGIAKVTSQENGCSTLQASVSYAKWPTTFVGGVSYGKSRIIIRE